MKEVKLNKNSWHFKYYSLVVSDNAPKSLCPYFWTMVLLIILSPIVGLGLGYVYIFKNVSIFFNKVIPKKKRKEPTYEELCAKWDKIELNKKKRERFWSKAGDVFLFFIKYIFLPFIILFTGYFMYIQITESGWLTTLRSLGLIILLTLFIFGLSKLSEFIGNNFNKLPKTMFKNFNPFNWKLIQIIGHMIKAQYTKMCPLITWEGEDKSKTLSV